MISMFISAIYRRHTVTTNDPNRKDRNCFQLEVVLIVGGQVPQVTTSVATSMLICTPNLKQINPNFTQFLKIHKKSIQKIALREHRQKNWILILQKVKRLRNGHIFNPKQTKLDTKTGHNLIKTLPKPKGTRDFYPEDKRLSNWLFAKFRNIASQFAFEEYDSPGELFAPNCHNLTKVYPKLSQLNPKV